ncbi:hypothetical protein CMV30_14280 [Nibricoccus aquaticus]|uniref:Phosphate ABC transporter substrate-binding protein n=1 Tax=Nibricoccus aquaticus TaxID=2576891 RepID=A0A290QLU0_9BACT|nr:hypothetical protein [Nibricoccus aquaticus]ATC65032.1 hypothetical protein CMV30_14280 [Nibricoccus aquaticus]
MKKFFLHVALIALASGLCTSLHAEPVLAAHPGLKEKNLDADDMKAVLLGKRVTLGDTRVIIIIAKTGDAQEAFLKDHVGMTTSQFQTHWRRLFMTGGGSAPKVVETEADACKLAAETPGAITVADSAAVTNGLISLGK